MGFGKDGQDSVENFRGDLFLRAHGGAGFIVAGNRFPVGAARELVVHRGGIFEVAEAGFLKILLFFCVGAGGFASDELLGLARRDLEIEHEGFVGQIVDVVFEMFDPGDEGGALFFADSGGLMREIGANVAVG